MYVGTMHTRFYAKDNISGLGYKTKLGNDPSYLSKHRWYDTAQQQQTSKQIVLSSLDIYYICIYMDKKCGGIEKVPNIVIIIFFQTKVVYIIYLYTIYEIPIHIPIIRTILPQDDYIRSAEQ